MSLFVRRLRNCSHKHAGSLQWPTFRDELARISGSASDFVRGFDDLNERFLDIAYDHERLHDQPEPLLRNIVELSQRSNQLTGDDSLAKRFRFGPGGTIARRRRPRTARRGDGDDRNRARELETSRRRQSAGCPAGESATARAGHGRETSSRPRSTQRRRTPR